MYCAESSVHLSTGCHFCGDLGALFDFTRSQLGSLLDLTLGVPVSLNPKGTPLRSSRGFLDSDFSAMACGGEYSDEYVG